MRCRRRRRRRGAAGARWPRPPGIDRFRRITLRTPDAARARAFYTTLFGPGWRDIEPLSEAAISRGARSLWLGQIGVSDVEASTSEFASRGAVRLGPTRRTADGGALAIVRDPGGAVVAMTSRAATPADGAAIWYHLNTSDVSRAVRDYRDLFGWHIAPRSDRGEAGRYHALAWRRGEPNIGSKADIAGRQGVHPHWLLHFQVAFLRDAASIVRGAGGVVIGPMLTPGGQPILVCDDPWGAAFALREGGTVADR